MREPVAARDWLTVFKLPPYAPGLNAVERSAMFSFTPTKTSRWAMAG
jgi:hypothetical protein